MVEYVQWLVVNVVFDDVSTITLRQIGLAENTLTFVYDD